MDSPTSPLQPGSDVAFATSSTSPQLVIVELMGDPAKVADAAGEYVKLYNPGPVDVDLSGFKVQSASGANVYTGVSPQAAVESHTIASSVVVPVGTCVVLGNNIASASNGGITTERYSYGTAITLGNNNTDWITIKTGSGALLDSVAYSPSTVNTAVSPMTRAIGSPSYTPAAGVAKSVLDPGVDNAVASSSNWATPSTTMTYGLGDRGTPNTCQYTWRSDGGTQVIGPLDHVVITGGTTVSAGGTMTLAASPQDASNAVVPNAVISWSTGDASIATVDGSGKVTGVSASATPVAITATAVAGGITKSQVQSVTVTVPEIRWIDLSSSSAAFPAGFQTQVFATARVSSGGTVVPATFVFEALDPAVATIANVNNTGIITGVSGSATKPRFRVTAHPTAGGPDYVFTTSSLVTIETPVFAGASIYGTNDAFGDPTPANASNLDDLLIARDQYTLSYNATRGTPNWVSYELDARQMQSGQDRCNCFTAEPSLPVEKQILTSDYTNGGYDRGHMARSADRTIANGDNATTYYLSNIVPQLADLNQGVWAQFENALGDSAKAGRAVYIITGPLYSRANPLRWIKNEGKVAIPDSTWKVAFIGPRNAGVPFDATTIATWGDLASTTVLAVNMPNVSGIRNDPWSKYLTTVDRIEKATGYDFLSVLPVAFQRVIESNDHKPHAVIASGSSTSEGSPLSFDASGSTDVDLARTDMDPAEALSFAWSFGDGTDGTGASVSKTWANNGSFTVTLIATDAYGLADTTTRVVAVSNVAPSVASFDGATILQGETYSASGSFSDPGADSFTGTVDYGDGSGVQSLALAGMTFQLGHAYSAGGRFTVSVGINDGDDTGARTATVVVETPAQGIANLNDALDAFGGEKPHGAAATLASSDEESLNYGQVNSLRVKLRNASRQLATGESQAAASMLGAFINELQAMVQSGRVPDEKAAPIIAYAERVIRSIGTL